MQNYNILNIVVNTELMSEELQKYKYYNILNIVVNTEPSSGGMTQSYIITY